MKEKYCRVCGEVLDKGRGKTTCFNCQSMLLKLQPGDERWKTEWCWYLPKFEDGAVDIDSAKYQRNFHTDKNSANDAARSLVGVDKFGVVVVTRVTWEDQHPNTPHAGKVYDWECHEEFEFTKY